MMHCFYLLVYFRNAHVSILLTPDFVRHSCIRTAIGITFWWFDDNWKFSIPPPNAVGNSTRPFQTWDGFSSVVWGAHLYFELVAWYNKHYRPADFPRPLTLNKWVRVIFKEYP